MLARLIIKLLVMVIMLGAVFFGYVRYIQYQTGTMQNEMFGIKHVLSKNLKKLKLIYGKEQSKIKAAVEKPTLPASAEHDQLDPSAYPDEWNYIKSSSRICWIHKVSKKKVCKNI